MNPDHPSLDAALHFEPLLIQADQEARQSAQDVAAARSSGDAIKAIAQVDFTPAVAGQIAAVLSARIAASSWSHFPEAISAMELLDGVHDELS